MHKWLQMPATPTDDPLATVYPINHYKKSHVYAVTRINPIYVDDEFRGHETASWNKGGSSGYESQPHSDHSSLEKNSPPAAAECLRHGRRTTATPPPSSPSDGSSAGGSLQLRTPAPWLSPIKEGVIDVRQYYCVPRPVWPGRDGDGYGDGGGGGDDDDDDADDDDADDGYDYDAPRGPPADMRRIPRVKCCRHCARLGGGGGINGNVGMTTGGSYSGYSSAYGGSAGGTVSTGTTASSDGGGGGRDCTAGCCSDDAVPSPGTARSVDSSGGHPPPLVLDPRFGDVRIGANKALIGNWNPVDLRLIQKTDNLHYDCGAMLRGLQFTLDAQQAEKLMQKIKVGKKQRCWCRLVTACLGLIMFLVSVITVSLTLTRGQKMFGSL